MTTYNQKSIELEFAKKAGELLDELWIVEPSPDEISWPDLIVTTDSGKFGLEVREMYPDESRKGSTKKGREKNNISKISQMADEYYKASALPIKVDILGDIDHCEEILSAITEEVPQLSEFEQKRIEPYIGCVVFIRKLPDELAKYKRWSYVSDKVGWVSDIDENLVQKSIDEKAKKLPKYSNNIADVRLLLVSNRIFNSGKVCMKKRISCDTRGFTNIYYLSYPDEICRLCS